MDRRLCERGFTDNAPETGLVFGKEFKKKPLYKFVKSLCTVSSDYSFKEIFKNQFEFAVKTYF